MSIAGKLTRDGWLLFATRCSRMFAYGLLSVVLVLYLVEVGLKEWEVGLLLSLTLVGDTVISLWLTTTADRFGRRRTLVVGAVLMALAGIVFVSTDSFLLLLLAATVGVISPVQQGTRSGRFLSVEASRHLSPSSSGGRTPHGRVCLVQPGRFLLDRPWKRWRSGLIAQESQRMGLVGAAAFRPVLLAYAGIGLALVGGFVWLSSGVEATRDESRPAPKVVLGLHESRRTVFKLSLLFALDALGGGFVIQSLIAYWFYLTYRLDPAMLGTIFLFANLLAGVSALAAGWLARRIGLVNTMVFTHLPSNVLLILVPLMP